jgi:hypothetical protein
MIRSHIFSAATLLGSVFLAGCAMADLAFAETETRPLADFTKVQASTGISVRVSCGTPARAVVTASPASGLERIKTEVENGTLSVRFRGMGSWSGGSASVVITAPNPITGIQASSGADIKMDDCTTAPNTLEAQASSGGSIKIGGKTAYFKAEVSSGGSISARELTADSGQFEASSGGSINACKARAVTAHASSGGSIAAGRGESIRVETSSGGSFSQSGC